MKIKKRWIILTALVILLGILSLPEIFHDNKGISESIGSVRKGQLKNGWLLPYKGKNHRYFDPFSYYILNNGYVHSSVYAAVMEAYHTCETTCPDFKFRIMECTSKHGGRMLIHWTHQNGKSVDFMVPTVKGENQDAWINKTGMFHYLLKFNDQGQYSLGKKTVIDFEIMARHLLALDDASQKQGLKIRKILLNTNLHDELFSTPSGKLLAQRNLRFIPRLNNLINAVHDDHYHVDFEFLNEEE